MTLSRSRGRFRSFVMPCPVGCLSAARRNRAKGCVQAGSTFGGERLPRPPGGASKAAAFKKNASQASWYLQMAYHANEAVYMVARACATTAARV